MNCDECRWFDSQKIEDRFNPKTQTHSFTLNGICRRYAPRQFVFPDTGEEKAVWPQTVSSNWCGEWEDTIDDSSERVTAEEAKPGRTLSDWQADWERISELAEKAKNLDFMGRPRTAKPGE